MLERYLIAQFKETFNKNKSLLKFEAVTLKVNEYFVKCFILSVCTLWIGNLNYAQAKNKTKNLQNVVLTSYLVMNTVCSGMTNGES